MIKRIAGTVAAVVIGSGIGFVAVNAAADDESTTAPTDLEQRRLALLKLEAGDALSPSALAAMKRKDGRFEPADSVQEAKVDKQAAVARAGVDLGFLNTGHEVNAVLGTYTVGDRTEPPSGEDPDMIPVIQDRLVWLVEVRGFSMPELGGPLIREPGTETPKRKSEGGSDGLFVIDAESGKLISGSQYSSSIEDID